MAQSNLNVWPQIRPEPRKYNSIFILPFVTCIFFLHIDSRCSYSINQYTRASCMSANGKLAHSICCLRISDGTYRKTQGTIVHPDSRMGPSEQSEITHRDGKEAMSCRTKTQSPWPEMTIVGSRRPRAPKHRRGAHRGAQRRQRMRGDRKGFGLSRQMS
ncbi:uncharacterized protein B0J16DRAFT_12577 [Fusarium flagelliforme]|uniref:uncharacterized protein n=1 Tax=Fusarium flagelliforme TaxID=2675880 RepID=UPI001E8EF1B3|nr:uncharacterized protein B0J16DRAFT_12577 [Fusarium flagelliforme]KAH7197082.1 hypothetical protein B0J16DRAFT_12577 [Fusarium flagelliforme]